MKKLFLQSDILYYEKVCSLNFFVSQYYFLLLLFLFEGTFDGRKETIFFPNIEQLQNDLRL
jgi:hypothetical protein